MVAARIEVWAIVVSFDTDIVVVGAGPTGLTMALQASMMGTSVRILERRSTPRPWAPALAIHPRTMEILRGLEQPTSF